MSAVPQECGQIGVEFQLCRSTFPKVRAEFEWSYIIDEINLFECPTEQHRFQEPIILLNRDLDSANH